MKHAASIAALLLAASAVFGAPSGEPIVLLPFANIAGSERGPDVIENFVAARLARRGYAVIRGDEVRAFLADERIRYVDSLSAPVREKLLAKFGARAAVLGAIFEYDEGENPIVGIDLRVIDAQGRVAWSNAVGLTGDDTEGALGFSRIAQADRLAEKVVRKLLSGFPAPRRSAHVSGARGKPFGASGPRTYRSSALAAGHRYRVFMLPLENRTKERPAARVVGELLARRLSASRLFDVVEPSDFRAAMVKAKLLGLKSGDPVQLKRLGDALGTNLVLTGTIYGYRDASVHNASIPPLLEMQLTLTDVAAGQIVWTGSVARKGTDYSGLFELGAISNMTTLADEVSAEMIRAAEKAHLSRPPLPASGPRVAASASGS